MKSPLVVLLTTIGLAACQSQSRFETCVEDRQKQFKAKNPGAPYSLLVNRREVFERECSHLK